MYSRTMRQAVIYYRYTVTALYCAAAGHKPMKRSSTVFGSCALAEPVTSKRTLLAPLTQRRRRQRLATKAVPRCSHANEHTAGMFPLERGSLPVSESRSTLAGIIPRAYNWLGEKKRRSFHFANWKSCAETEHQTNLRTCVELCLRSFQFRGSTIPRVFRSNRARKWTI